MMESINIRGVIPAIVTPFTGNAELDKDGLRRLTRFLLDNGVHAIMTTGGNGEFPHLLREEKRIITETVVKEVDDRIPVIAGTAACSTMETQLLSNDAKEAGANAVIVTPPYYFRLPDESVFRHFQILTETIDIPLIIYNNPLYTGNNLDPALIDRIVGLKGIIGLKQSNSDFGQLVETLRRSGSKISICTGIDSQFYPSLCAGAKGVFSTAACVIPKQMVQLYDIFQKGKHEQALELHVKIQELNCLLEYDPGYVSPCKEALTMLGLPAGPVRDPLPELTSKERDALKDALKNSDLL
ncbi:MAG: dihydrodipicolinate synthase family protein [Deltaproteobacteria bacterium]|nr:dihydrodipicolinate synthase family protein [Deltaproteobacteria bacterium]MBW2033540.1 dihydrodipicolinate synthase family protein [Deltaproteobacteria bacterium]MBW2357798.1 dihydrodipicolinate synthase family protein [Deltaproteobacteria bacterium]